MERIRNAFLTFQGWILWILPHAEQYIPNGADEFERELQLALYNFLKVPIEINSRAFMTFLPQLRWCLMPYFEEDLSLLDWFCSMLCHFYGFFWISFIIFVYIDRLKALYLHFMSLFVVVILGFTSFFDHFWLYYFGRSLRHPSAYKGFSNYNVFLFGNACTTFMYLFMIAYAARLYGRIRDYRKLRDARILAFELKKRRHLFGG
uniref:Transmembrane protein 18 n=1 Tax=Panagrolaimus sp. PS1159 TaxID=55785 RepID=A0AC35EXW7_9BILA